MVAAVPLSPKLKFIVGALIGGIGFSLSSFIVYFNIFKSLSLSAYVCFSICGFLIGIIEGLLDRSIFRTVIGGLICAVGGLLGFHVLYVVLSLTPEWEWSLLPPVNSFVFIVVGAFIGLSNGIFKRLTSIHQTISKNMWYGLGCVAKRVILGMFSTLTAGGIVIIVFLLYGFLQYRCLSYLLHLINFINLYGILFGGFIAIASYIPPRENTNRAS